MANTTGGEDTVHSPFATILNFVVPAKAGTPAISDQRW
jgi:hypothetical protein